MATVRTIGSEVMVACPTCAQVADRALRVSPMTIKKLSREKLREIADLMISTTTMCDRTWLEIVSIACGDKLLARRATEWLPEAFLKPFT